MCKLFLRLEERYVHKQKLKETCLKVETKKMRSRFKNHKL